MKINEILIPQKFIPEKQLNELFDQPYEYKWENQRSDLWGASFQTDNGQWVFFEAELEYGIGDEKLWHIAFATQDTDGDYQWKRDNTGKGEEIKIFSTVVSAFTEWFKTTKPNKLIFSSDGTDSRDRLYRRFANLIAKRGNMKLEINDKRKMGLIQYILTKKEPITEALADVWQYRPLFKGWKKERYQDIFMSHPANMRDRNGYRLYFPLGAPDAEHREKSNEENRIEWFLHQNGYTIVDYKKGLAKNIETGQQIKIGKLLHKLKANLHLDSFNNDKSRQGVGKEYMVVISRHPADIIGMSTNRGWHSCMNLKNGEEKEYVPLEVEAGTIIAYLTTTDDRNLNNPSARVLMKPFVDIKDPDNKDFLYLGVENEFYGENVHEKFLPTVEQWADDINDAHALDDAMVVVLNPKSYKEPHSSSFAIAGGDKEERQARNKELSDIAQNPTYYLSQIPDPSEEIQLTAVEADPDSLRYIDNPTLNVQKRAVGAAEHEGWEYQPASQPHMLQFINNPHPKIQKICILAEPRHVQFVDNPDKDVQMYVVKEDPGLLGYINDPHPDVVEYVLKDDGELIELVLEPTRSQQKLAVTNAPNAIFSIENPTDEAQLIAVKADGLLLKDINDYPNYHVQMAAVKQNGLALEHVFAKHEEYASEYDLDEDIDEDVILAAVENDGMALQYVPDHLQDGYIQMAAIENEPDAIQYVDEPDEDLQIEAVKQDYHTLQYLPYSSEKVQRTAINNNWRAIEYIMYPSKDIKQLVQARQRAEERETR